MKNGNKPRVGHGKRKKLMDSPPYSYETLIFPFDAPREEVKGTQTKLHPGFTLQSKLVQLSPGIWIFRDSHIVLSKLF